MKWLLAGLLFSTSSMASNPRITLRYSEIFDMWCSQSTGVPIQDSEVDTLLKKLPSLQEQWDNNGPILVETTERIFKKTFTQNEMIATVFLCKKTPSMSMPLLINGNWFTPSIPIRSEIVVDIIYHELIHTYLDDNFYESALKSSQLLEKYKAEGPAVGAHMHLMAVQKYVYLQLGLTQRITDVINFDSNFYAGAYKRSWEIVNSEGEMAFVRELNPNL